MFFSVGEELTLLSLHGKIQSRSFKATDDTRTFRWKLHTAFTPFISIYSFRYHSSRSLGPLVVEYRWKRPVYYLFYPTQGLHDVFSVEMLRTYV